MDFDITIVGGGMIGASLACALSGLGLRIAVLEATAPSTTQQHSSYDDKAIALSQSTLCTLSTLNLLTDLPLTPIRSIHISDRGQAGMARLYAHAEGVDKLGAVTTARLLGKTLWQSLGQHSDITLLCPVQLIQFQQCDEHIELSLQEGQSTRTLYTRLLVAADGAQSPIRQRLGIALWQYDYQQNAIIANVSPELDHQNIAFERFTRSGPVALLPLSEQRCALVFSVEQANTEALLRCSDEDFLHQLQQRFGDRLGRFQQLGQRSHYPLHLILARQQYQQRTVLIGNAAHTLHPIAGQGFNLGLRDVAALADVIAQAQQADDDIGGVDVLRRYADWRRWDQRRAALFTHGLAQFFSSTLWPIKLARNAGLLAFDLFPPAKHLLARHAMGLPPPLPRLTRGIKLST